MSDPALARLGHRPFVLLLFSCRPPHAAGQKQHTAQHTTTTPNARTDTQVNDHHLPPRARVCVCRTRARRTRANQTLLFVETKNSPFPPGQTPAAPEPHSRHAAGARPAGPPGPGTGDGGRACWPARAPLLGGSTPTSSISSRTSPPARARRARGRGQGGACACACGSSARDPRAQGRRPRLRCAPLWHGPPDVRRRGGCVSFFSRRRGWFFF